MRPLIECRLCAGRATLLFERTVLERHVAGYYQCERCGLTQTSEPEWIEEAYASGHALHPTDTGVLARNLGARRVVATFLHLSGVANEPCLDYGSGYGIFVRLMRDAGFNFFGLDPRAENLVARGFEWSERHGRPRACTAFEVLEHFVRPLEEFRKVATHGADFIITSTELHPGRRPAADWPYLSPESGQHVSFYREDTIRRLGSETGYTVVRAGPFFQLFARRSFPGWRWRLATQASAVLFPLVRRARHSLTLDDCERLRREEGAQ